jgi:hypothetical protein
MVKAHNSNRWRCLTVGCNPVLFGAEAADAHSVATKHRTAKWPTRSEVGELRAKARNRSGYYDKYNVGAKSAAARGIGRNGRPERNRDGGLFFSSHSQDGDDE